MKIEILTMFQEDNNAFLTSYIRSNPSDMANAPRPAVIICPGGGYEHVSNRENEPIALQFLARGYNAFVLTYSVKEKASSFLPLSELRRSLEHVRANALEYNIDKNRIYVIGFSAGGHLALSSGVHLPKEERPNALLLAYPVVTATCDTHLGTLHNFCGSSNPSPDQIHDFSLDLHVDRQTPPCFIWHTETDAAVPVQNSLNLVKALENNEVPYELHLFPYGEHGLSLATHETCPNIPENEPHPASVWVELADKWLKNL